MWKNRQIDQLTQLTDGFSFAYLKELVVGSITQWISQGNTPLDAIVMNQANILKSQMKSD